ncbi:unnamed protein product, partial [Candidula unifasciata]
ITPSIKPLVYETTVKQGPEPGVGTWGFTLDPVAGNTTVSIKVTSQGVSLTLTDVIFGDVWICSGQSNMAFTVIMMYGAAEELEDAHNYPLIRLMTVENANSTTPLYDLAEIKQSWTTPSNVSLGGPIWTYFSAVCWLYGKAIHRALGYPIGLVATSYGGTPVEAWSSHQSLARCGVDKERHYTEDEISFSNKPLEHSFENHHKLPQDRLGGPSNNSVLWNAMVYPLLGMTIKGAIWYQGESDASGTRLVHYNCTFPSMIRDWRQNFHNFSNGETDLEFPFGFVQLAGYRPNSTTTRGFPDIRWHQTADQGYVPNNDMPNVFMAVAMDLPNFNSTYGPIHPQYKKEVADRLALGGLSVAYGRNLVYQGPFPVRQEVTSSGVVISYGNTWNVTVRTPDGFELLCVRGTRSTWTKTQIVSNNQTSVILGLTCSAGQQVTSVRYAWKETPCDFKKCAIYETTNELPGPPFLLNISADDNITS